MKGPKYVPRRPPLDAEAATEVAMRQAVKAGLPSLLIIVESAKKDKGDWEVVLRLSYSERKYRVLISARGGNILEWEEIQKHS